jgi:excisionase family DNA binding protein
VGRERFLTPEDVAKELSVSPLSVRHWLRSGRLKGVKISNLWRIRESEVDRFIAKREQLNQEETAQ